MWLVVLWHLACLDIKIRLSCAGAPRATPAAGVDRAVLSMLLAEHRRCLAALDIKARALHAGIMRATLAADVHHVVLSMLLAVHRRSADLDAK